MRRTGRHALQRLGDHGIDLDIAASAVRYLDLRTFFSKLTAEHRPYSGAFRYISANADLLGLVIEAATGESFAKLASELLWMPLGAEQPAYITLDPAGAAECTRGMGTCARDLARIGQLLVDGGSRGARTIVPTAWIEDTTGGGDPEAWAKGEFAAGFGNLPMRYRNLWYVRDQSPQVLFAMGVYGQNLFVDRTNELVVAKFSSQPSQLPAQMIGLSHLAVAEIRRCLAPA